jgi:rfaE bifunctional protein nucleotidyltransferase chain/domain
LGDGESGMRKVFVNGCFDVLHVGHIRLLQYARTLGDELIVAINDDDSVRKRKGPDRPIFSKFERMEMLEALSCVKRVIYFEEDSPLQVLTHVWPDIVVKGSEYEKMDFPERQFLHNAGIEMKFFKMTDHSTSKILERL